jgi:hypothetical protein
MGVQRIKIIGRECPRIGAEFLDKMRQKLGPMLSVQEFEGEFIDAESLAFSFEMIELALVNDEDADWGDPGVNEHVEYQPSDPGEIDDELEMARQLCQEPTDMGDDGGVRRTKR